MESDSPLSVRLDDVLERSYAVIEGDSPSSKAEELIAELENVTRSVASLGLFSSNEEIEDVSTTSLRFFLLPAHLGQLTLHLCDRRYLRLEQAEIYLRDYLQRLCIYRLITDNDIRRLAFRSQEDSEERSSSSAQDVPTIPAQQKAREAKILRYRKEEELKQKINQLRDCKTQGLACDEDKLRELYLQELQLNILRAESEMSTIAMEKPFAKRRAMQGDTVEPLPQPVESMSTRPPMKTVILTRSQVQKKVFGAGYPSLPTMTIEEWCDEEIRAGRIDLNTKDAGATPTSNGIDELEKTEGEQEQERKKAQDWDEYTDTHRRGWGNTYNKG